MHRPRRSPSPPQLNLTQHTIIPVSSTVLPEEEHVGGSSPGPGPVRVAGPAPANVSEFPAPSRVDPGEVDVGVDGPKHCAKGHQDYQYYPADKHCRLRRQMERLSHRHVTSRSMDDVRSTSSRCLKSEFHVMGRRNWYDALREWNLGTFSEREISEPFGERNLGTFCREKSWNVSEREILELCGEKSWNLSGFSLYCMLSLSAISNRPVATDIGRNFKKAAAVSGS